MRHAKAVVVAGVGVAMVIAGCSSKPATTTSSTPTSPAANPALNGLLLSPDSINKAMGAKAMIVSGNYTDLLDDSSTVSDAACRITTIDADVDSYANSGYTAVHEQALQERGQHSAYYTDQAVVLFPSADKAAAFYASMAQRWPACSNRDFTRTPNGAPAQHWAVGPISNANGVLSNVITEKGMTDQNCERAITVSGAVAVDVSTCTHANAAGTAAGIAQQIAAKVQK